MNTGAVVWIDDAYHRAAMLGRSEELLRFFYADDAYWRAWRSADVIVDVDGRPTSTRVQRREERWAAAKALAEAIGVDSIRGLYAAPPPGDDPAPTVDVHVGDQVAWSASPTRIATVWHVHANGTVDLEVDSTCVPDVQANGLRVVERQHVLGLAAMRRIYDATSALDDLMDEVVTLAPDVRRRLRAIEGMLTEALAEVARPADPVAAHTLSPLTGMPLRSNIRPTPERPDAVVRNIGKALGRALYEHGRVPNEFTPDSMRSYGCAETPAVIMERAPDVVAYMLARGYDIDYTVTRGGPRFRIASVSQPEIAPRLTTGDSTPRQRPG